MCKPLGNGRKLYLGRQTKQSAQQQRHFNIDRKTYILDMWLEMGMLADLVACGLWLGLPLRNVCRLHSNDRALEV